MKEECTNTSDVESAPDGSLLYIEYTNGESVEVATMKSGRWEFYNEMDEVHFRLLVASMRIDQQER